MRCTAKKTFEAAAQAGIALIVQVKGNRPTLHELTLQLHFPDP